MIFTVSRCCVREFHAFKKLAVLRFFAKAKANFICLFPTKSFFFQFSQKKCKLFPALERSHISSSLLAFHGNPFSISALPSNLPAKSFFSTIPFSYQNVLESATNLNVEYRKLDHLDGGISTVQLGSKKFLEVQPELLTSLTREAILDVSHLLRTSHLRQLSSILKDPQASKNDKFVALELIKNATIAASRVLPGCQDTGTAIVIAKKGQHVLTQGNDEIAISKGVYDAYTTANLRYSQLSPNTMFQEVNTKSNLPAQIEIYSTDKDFYEFIFITKGGGSANKTFLFQETKALLNPNSLLNFLSDKIRHIGTSACPPYHLAIVIGGMSAEFTLKVVKLASCRYLDNLHTSGNSFGRAFRDIEWEDKILNLCNGIGIGAQFGGKYFCHDVRVIRLPRHGASCPVGIGVSCSADRQAFAKISEDGVYLEQLERNPEQFLPDLTDEQFNSGEVVDIDLNVPMKEILQKLSNYPVSTRLSLSGSLIVARDIAHSKLAERLEKQGYLPEYIKNHPIYYAGPAKTPKNYVSGSFGPTTAGRMDSYVSTFMKHGGSLITLAKGNRSNQVVKSCKTYGGFYLGSIGGPAAILAQSCIKNVEIVEFAELGMEAVFKIEVKDFPAFIIIDNKGNDFYNKFTS